MKTYHVTVETIGGARHVLAPIHGEDELQETIDLLYLPDSPGRPREHSLRGEGRFFVIAPRAVASVRVVTEES